MLKKYFNKTIERLRGKRNIQTKHYTQSINFSEYAGNDARSISVDASAYYSNVVVNKCVNLIIGSASHVPLRVFKKDSNNKLVICSKHPANMILARPSVDRAGADFISELIANLLLYGNSYVVTDHISGSLPNELKILHPSDTEIIAKNKIILGYKYRNNSFEKFYPLDPLDRMSRVLHFKNYHPTDSIYGLSYLKAASSAIFLHGKTMEWNQSLMKNSSRPSGALLFKDGDRYLSDEQFERLKEQFYENFSGSANSGKPMILEGGLVWQESSSAEKFEKFLELKDSTARDIAVAFNIPPQLLGINGDNTYSNMQEARLAFWEENIIPLLDKIGDNFSNWLSHWYKEELKITFDLNVISALTEKRENLWGKIDQANFMTINEKRALVGLDQISGGDILA